MSEGTSKLHERLASFDEQYVVISAVFDRAFYLDIYPDVAESGVDPVQHYVSTGAREGRDPTRWFATTFYLQAHPEVSTSGSNPLYHYLTVGRGRGWPAQPPGGLTWPGHMPKSGTERLHAALQAAPRLTLTQLDKLEEAASLASHAHVTVGHDDFRSVVGGVELCIAREAEALGAERAHIHLWPAIKLPTVSDDPNYALNVMIDGVVIGTFKVAELKVLAAALAGSGSTTIAVHSLLGHEPAELARQLRAFRPRKSFFWIHDFAAACDGYTLLYNDRHFCGGPSRGASICKSCVYGDRRERHLSAHDAMLRELAPQLVAPSELAAEIWRRSRSSVEDDILIHPHGTLHASDNILQTVGPEFHVAFLGLPLPHKGWQAFKMLSDRLSGDARFVFHHFGETPDLRSKAIFHRVTVSAQAPTQMTDALRLANIEAAVIWSICPETFCLTAHEAAAAGAFLITNSDSGAAAALAAEPGRGAVLDTSTGLLEYFRSGAVIREARLHPRCTQNLRLGALSCDLMPKA